MSNKWYKILLFTLLIGGIALAASVDASQDKTTPITLPSPGAVGGGWTDAGPLGEYFASETLAGTPAFTRRDVRIDFDWGTLALIGGSNAEPYHSFPHDHFSVRWTGNILPRFSEPYTFTFSADSPLAVTLKSPQTSQSQSVVSGQPVALQAGTSYQLVVEYRHATGKAFCQLHWSSPSTPREVIDPVIEQGLNLASFGNFAFADVTKTQSWVHVGKMCDDQGQLKLTDGGDYLFAEASHAYKGTYALSFTGQASISCHLFGGKFIVNGKEMNVVPRGVGYDAARNTTSVLLKCNRDDGTFNVRFDKASRDAGGTQPGITDLHIMRPIEHNSEQPHQVDEITYRPLKRMASYFTTLRWLHIANVKCTGLWKDRTLPTEPRFARRPDPKNGGYYGGENWEYLIMFANETGRDLYLCTPMTADDEYLRKLALLLRYGSDGVNPYTQPTAHPKYPPLNPNLRITFEVGNEIWNWAFLSSKACEKMTADAVANKSDIGQIINYDGKENYRRFHVVRTVTASNIFREVFGDAAMGQRIRPLIEFQYANMNNTAGLSFNFLDAYYNNGDGEHVKEPHPARYYVWGSGGAAYYGVGNEEGVQKEFAITDDSFEDHRVAEGDRSSAKSAWEFKGTAGVYRSLSSAVTAYIAGPRATQTANTAVGMRFKTGDHPLWVYRLARVYNRASDKGAHISIFRADNLKTVASGETGPIISYLERIYGFYWADLPDKKPIQLQANTEYLLVTQDIGPPQRTNIDTTITTSPDLTGIKAVTITMADPQKAQTWKVTDGEPNRCTGPVNMLFAQKPDVTCQFPQPPDGQQAAYIIGTGEISQVVNFPKAGTFALSLNIGRPKVPTAFRVFFDDQNISPSSQADFIGNHDAFTIGGFGRNGGFKEEWGSAVFTIDKPGPHTIRIAGSPAKNEQSYTVIDHITIASADALLDSGFGSGSALGQPVDAQWSKSQVVDSRFGWCFGLPRVAYEAGWSVGGDFNQKPLQAFCKLRDPRAQPINDQAIHLFAKSGGRLQAFGVYTYWQLEDIDHGQDCPIMKSIIKASQHLPPEPENGALIPATLTPDNAVKWAANQDLTAPGKWLGWTIVCPKTAVYRVSTQTSTGGKFDLDADGVSLGAPVDSSLPTSYLVKMTQGLHGIRIRNRRGNVTLKSITVTPAPD